MKSTRTTTTVTPTPTANKRDYYDGAELKPFEGRVGAMDAYKLPSIRGGKAVEPSLYMRDFKGETK